MTFAFAGKWLENLKSKEIFCVHRWKTLNVSTGRGFKILREWIQYLYNNVIDCLFVVTSQSINDRREQTLRLDTSQLTLIRHPFCALSVLTGVTSRGELKRTVCVFWSWTSRPSFHSERSCAYSKSYGIHIVFQQ